MLENKSYRILRFASGLRAMNQFTFTTFALVFCIHNILLRVAGLTVLDKVILKYRCTHGYEFYARADDYWRFVDHFEPKTTVFMLQKLMKILLLSMWGLILVFIPFILLKELNLL